MIAYIMVSLACLSQGCEYERTNWRSFNLTVPAVFETYDECEAERVQQERHSWNRGMRLNCVALKDRKTINGPLALPQQASLIAIPQTCPPDVPAGECSRPREVQQFPGMRECLAAQVKVESQWHTQQYSTRYRCTPAGGMP